MLYYIGYGVTCDIDRKDLPYCKNNFCECNSLFIPRIDRSKIVITPQLNQVVFSTINIPLQDHKQTMIVLHANAIDIEGKYIIIIGDSGVGKTTLTIHSITHGQNNIKFVADDIVLMDKNCVIFPCSCRPLLIRTENKSKYVSSTDILNSRNTSSHPNKVSCVVFLYRDNDFVDRIQSIIKNVWNATAENIAAVMSIPFINSRVYIDDVDKTLRVLYNNLKYEGVI